MQGKRCHIQFDRARNKKWNCIDQLRGRMENDSDNDDNDNDHDHDHDHDHDQDQDKDKDKDKDKDHDQDQDQDQDKTRTRTRIMTTLIEDGFNMCQTSGPAGVSDGVTTPRKSSGHLIR